MPKYIRFESLGVTGGPADYDAITTALAAKVSTTGTELLSSDANNAFTVNVKHWKGTQTQYDAIGSPDANTLYTITA